MIINKKKKKPLKNMIVENFENIEYRENKEILKKRIKED